MKEGVSGQSITAIICICVYQYNALTSFTFLLVQSHISSDSISPRLWILEFVQGTFRGTSVSSSGQDVVTPAAVPPCRCSGVLFPPAHPCQCQLVLPIEPQSSLQASAKLTLCLLHSGAAAPCRYRRCGRSKSSMWLHCHFPLPAFPFAKWNCCINFN